MSKKIYETDAQTMADLTAGKETVWKNPRYVPFDLVRGLCDLVVSEADIADAEARLARFAPFLERAFPETQANHGLIESPLAELEKMQPALEKAYGGKIPGRLLLKKDSHLDIAGSVKARGGIYEVLKHAEDLALAAGKITVTDDYAAKKKADEEGRSIDIHDYSYHGRKPQTKEAAILMMADTVEAATRTLKERTRENMTQMIRKLVRDKFDSGELNESPITFRELNEISDAFVRTLMGIYHERIEYPNLDALKKESAAAELPAKTETPQK